MSHGGEPGQAPPPSLQSVQIPTLNHNYIIHVPYEIRNRYNQVPHLTQDTFNNMTRMSGGWGVG